MEPSVPERALRRGRAMNNIPPPLSTREPLNAWSTLTGLPWPQNVPRLPTRVPEPGSVMYTCGPPMPPASRP